jgi:hypothetical protein
VSGDGRPRGRQTHAEITFPAGTLAGARSLLLQQNALRSTRSAGRSVTSPQVISPTAPAAKTAKKFRKARVLRRAAKRR